MQKDNFDRILPLKSKKKNTKSILSIHLLMNQLLDKLVIELHQFLNNQF
jgi:hypothetical protein